MQLVLLSMRDVFGAVLRALSGLAILITLSHSAFAAIEPVFKFEKVIAANHKQHKYIDNGIVTGGEAGAFNYTLLNVRRFLSPKDKIERIFFDIGDMNGKPLTKKVSYYQASIDKKNQRIVLDLAQMSASGVNAAKIQKIFKASPYVKKVAIKFDPIDNTITIQLNLKTNMKLEAFNLPGKKTASRIVLDIKEKS